MKIDALLSENFTDFSLFMSRKEEKLGNQTNQTSELGAGGTQIKTSKNGAGSKKEQTLWINCGNLDKKGVVDVTFLPCSDPLFPRLGKSIDFTAKMPPEKRTQLLPVSAWGIWETYLSVPLFEVQ